jgi:hypothetical protein
VEDLENLTAMSPSRRIGGVHLTTWMWEVNREDMWRAGVADGVAGTGHCP